VKPVPTSLRARATAPRRFDPPLACCRRRSCRVSTRKGTVRSC